MIAVMNSMGGVIGKEGNHTGSQEIPLLNINKDG